MSAFSVSTRVICCGQCAEPISGPDGGQVSCQRCGQPVQFRPRASYLRSGTAPPPGAQHPHFRAQDGKPLLPPPNIAFLWENGNEIPVHRRAEAVVAWQGARRRAAAMDVGAGEEICMLTRELASEAEKAGDPARARAFIESGLEAVQLPRQKSVLLGMITRLAVRSGDPHSAAHWVAFFEPPADLESESEHRMSAAVVATARGDYMSVLAALGTQFNEIAIQDALDPQAAMFRINALERLGRGPEAQQQLASLLQQGPPFRTFVERIQAQYQSLSLCAGTLPAVLARHEQSARSSAGTGKIGMGCLLMAVSVLPVGIMSAVALYTYFVEGETEPLIMIPFSLIFVLAFGLWGFKTLRNGLRERRVFASGVRAAARVLGASPTGVLVNHVPEMQIHLDVQLQPPIRTSIRTLVSPGEIHMLTPGTLLHIRVDPKNPDLAVLDQ